MLDTSDTEVLHVTRPVDRESQLSILTLSAPNDVIDGFLIDFAVVALVAMGANRWSIM